MPRRSHQKYVCMYLAKPFKGVHHIRQARVTPRGVRDTPPGWQKEPCVVQTQKAQDSDELSHFKFGFRNRHGDRARRAWILSVSRGFIGKKVQMGFRHEEEELEAVQTLENL